MAHDADRDQRNQIAAAARLREREGKHSEALKAWEFLAEANPRDGAARTEAVRLRRQIAQRDEIARLLEGPDQVLQDAVNAALDAEDHFYVIHVRRGQLARRRDTRTLAALASALRRSRTSDGPAWVEADSLLHESIALDSDKRSNAETFTALGALLRARRRLTTARELLEEVQSLNHDQFSAAALAGVYLDRVEQGNRDDLPRAQRMIDSVYARVGPSKEVSSLYGRYDSLVKRDG